MSLGLHPLAKPTRRSCSLRLMLTLGVLGMVRPFPPARANDLFAERTPKQGVSWSESASNRNATKEVGEPPPVISGATGRSLWWTWTAPEAGAVSIDTYPSSHYSALGVYQGNSLASLVLVSQDTSFTFPDGSSQVNFEVVAGATFEISVDGYVDPLSFVLNLDLAPLATNDAFAQPVQLIGATNHVRVHNLNCTTEPGEPIPSGTAPFRSAWWAWTAPSNGLATIDTRARAFRTRVSVHAGEPLTRVASETFREHSFGSCAFMATKGVNYLIGVDAPDQGTGVVDFTLRQPDGAPEIVLAPSDSVVGRADPAVLSGAIAGTLPIHFQWFFGEQPIPGETNATLRIPTTLESNTGAYQLRASNAWGMVITPPATLAIATNWIEIVPSTLSVLEGNRASFSVRRSGFTNALDVQLVLMGSALPGVDFAPLPQNLRFSQGQTNITLTYQTLDDPDEEPARSLAIDLMPDPHHSTANQPLLLIEQQDDDPNIRLSAVPGFARRFSPEPAMVLFQRTGNLDRTLAVPFGVSGSARPVLDFDPPASPVVFQPGQSVVPVPFAAAPGLDPTDRTLVVTAEPDPTQTYVLRLASAQVDIVANRAPRIRITSPEMWSGFPSGQPVRLSSMAEDPDGTVGRVEFLEDARLLASRETLPFAADVILSPGIHLIRARAIDNRGASTESEPVSIVVGTSPAPGSLLSSTGLPGFPQTESTTANGASWGPEANPGTSRIAFTSAASDLAGLPLPQTSLGTHSQVWLHDPVSGSNVLASATTAGFPGNGDSTTVAGGFRGEWLVFQSEADNLTTIDLNQSTDLFARNIRTGELVLLSARASYLDSTGNGPSEQPTLSQAGTRVVFESRASNLVSGDANGASDVFVRDLPGATNRLVSINSVGTGPGNAASHSAIISLDGRRVAFISTSTNLVPDQPVLRGHAFVRDIDTSATRCVSAGLPNLLTVLGIRPSQIPRYRCHNLSLSADGRYVAFKASADNAIDPNLILRYDWDSGSIETLTVSAVQSLSVPNDNTTSALSLDGQVIAYETTNHVRVWNGRAGSDTAIAVRADGTLPTVGWSRSPTLTPDGGTVTFLSNSPDLTAESMGDTICLYERGVGGGPATLVSRSTADTPLRATGTATWIPGTRRILFTSEQADTDGTDLNRASDILLRDLDSGTTRLISRRWGTAARSVPQADILHPRTALSADRSRMAVVTSAGIDPKDTNRVWDIYLWDRTAGSLALASVNTNGTAAAKPSRFPALSGDGRVLAFISSSGDLAPNDNNQMDDVFVRDLQAATTVLVSSNRFGSTSSTAASGAAAPVLSHTGEWVGFVNSERNLVPEQTFGPNLYLRHWRTGRLVRVVNAFSDRSVKTIVPLHLTDSPIATYTHSSSRGIDIFVSDTVEGRHFSHGPLLSRPVVTPDGRFTAYVLSSSGQPVHVFDRNVWTNVTAAQVLPTGNPAVDNNRIDVDISDDGRRVAFVSSRSLDPLDTNATNDVYVFELPGGPLRLASGNRFGTGVGNAPATAPQLSPDGRFVVFRSRASNLMPGTVSGENLYVRDLESQLLWQVACLHRGPGRGAYPGTPSWAPDHFTMLFRSLTLDSTAHAQPFSPPLLSFVIPASLQSDLDSDGMDDAWEWKWFGSQARDGSDDWDQDGVADREEFIAGTDPRRQDAPLTLLIVEPDPEGVAILRWPASSGRVYDVLGIDDLSREDWQVLSSNVQSSSGIATFRIDTRERTHRYFRIMVKP